MGTTAKKTRAWDAKRITLVVCAVAAPLVVAGFVAALREELVDGYYAWRLAYGDPSERDTAVARLLERESCYGLPALLGAVIKDNPVAERISQPLKTLARRSPEARTVLFVFLRQRADSFPLETSAVVRWLLTTASTLRSQGELAASASISRLLIEWDPPADISGHSPALEARNTLGLCYLALERLEEAESTYRSFLEPGARNPETADSHQCIYLNNYATVLVKAGKASEALEVAHEAQRLTKTAYAHNSKFIAAIQKTRGACLTRLGRYDEAEKDLLESLEVLEATPETWNRLVTITRQYLVELYEAWGKPELARRYGLRDNSADAATDGTPEITP